MHRNQIFLNAEAAEGHERCYHTGALAKGCRLRPARDYAMKGFCNPLWLDLASIMPMRTVLT